MSMPGQVPAPNYGQPAAQTTPLPVISFVFGLLAFCIPFIGGLIAVVTGFMGYKKAKALGQGTGLATAGIILGFVGLMVSVISAILFVASLATVSTVKNEANNAFCAANIATVDTAIAAYQATTGHYPTNAADLSPYLYGSMPASPTYTFNGPMVAPTHGSC